ncbi:MAG: peptidoglycan D,D-transpeptidase FtsI family protein [Solirubrobacteraceae bacterium]
MNRPISRLFTLIVVLFALLVAFTSRWTVFEAASLRSNPENKRSALAQERIERGEILAANGETIAKSRLTKAGTYERLYPMGSLFTAPVGYSFANYGSAGLEQYRNAQLGGSAPTGIERLLNQLEGVSTGGDTLETTLRPAIQRAAMSALAGREGAVVAIEPKTGEVEALASSPTFSPPELTNAAQLKRLDAQRGSPLFNRATQGAYAPGSSFKLVTLTAALNSGILTPQSRLSGRDGRIVSGVPLHNDLNENYGYITLTEALAKSVNTVYAQVAEHDGPQRLTQYMERFGFYHLPQIDLPASEMRTSGVYAHGKLELPTSGEIATDIGRVGIGQGEMEATPLQMAEVVATIANGGKLMRPHLTRRVIDSEGRTLETVAPKVLSEVMRASTAAEVTTMMEAVVKEGTGQGVQIPGVRIAGKTGTAETEEPGRLNNAWFVCFAPANEPKIALAATVANVEGYGATFALPVAKQVLEAALGKAG